MNALGALHLTSFISGFCLMALELLGARYLQPVFGSSIDLWAAIISVFILSLAAGYALGGWLGDRVRTNAALGWMLVAAAVCYLLLPIYARPVSEWLGPDIHAARWGPLLASLLLFLPPSVLLGCVTPLLVTLGVSDVGRVGRTTGMLYAVSALGNVLGVLLSDYVLLASFTLNVNMAMLGLCLGVTGLAHLLRPMARAGRSAGAGTAATVALGLLVAASTAGFRYQDPPYRIGARGFAADAVVLAHRDSPYAHLTWALSRELNQLTLLFFDRPHGAVCLEPRWDDALAQVPAGAPNPGTLTSTTYFHLYPAALLLHERLMREAQGRLSAARPRMLMVGLGIGAGVSLLAHHVPQASTDVVEIDPEVVAMVREHYPFLRWLEGQRTEDGRARLRLLIGDARQVIRRLAQEDVRYDVVILDAYGLGTLVPPHLMTREFYEEVGAVLAEDGIMVSNVPGSYTGRQHRLLGGAARTLRAAGFRGVHNVPVPIPGSPLGTFDPSILRNNLLFASRRPLEPADRPAAWQAMAGVVLYPELPEGRYVSRTFYLGWHGRILTAKVPLFFDGRPVEPGFETRLTQHALFRGDRRPVTGGFVVLISDRELTASAGAAVRQAFGARVPAGWAAPQPDAELIYEELDWVRLARETFRAGVALGLASGGPALTRGAPLFTDAKPNADMLR
jgi:spermidine synthase